MNHTDLARKLSALEGEELVAAKALLSALGIDTTEKKPTTKTLRTKFTSKLNGYYERISSVCTTCGAEHIRLLEYSEQVRDGQHYLQSHNVQEDMFETKDIKTKHTRMDVIVCMDCATNLLTWSKEDLIRALLTIRTGDQYAKIATKK